MERKGEHAVPETRPIPHLRLHHLQLSCGCLTSTGFGGKLPWQWGSGLTHTNSPPCSGASEGSVQQPQLELRPGEYRVLLCVDVGETKG